MLSNMCFCAGCCPWFESLPTQRSSPVHLPPLWWSPSPSWVSQMFTEPVLLNVYGAPELIPRNEFRQSTGGPVRKPYSSSMPSPHRLFKNSSSVHLYTVKKKSRNMLKGLGARSYVKNDSLRNGSSGYLFQCALQLIFSAIWTLIASV